MERFKKAFVLSVMLTTVLSMSVIVAPAADAASAGDLIKMDGLSSVYYLAGDGKRYVFPNENTYFSWYGDFSSVVTIAQSELEGYPLGKNITMRPGTNLVKITTDPKVYAVEPNGNLVWVPSEAVATALYGADWADRVVDVPDSFFTNYTVTGDEVSDDAYPAGSLFKMSDAADVYYMDEDGTARKIASEAAFTANRFMWDDILTAPEGFTLPTMGDDIDGAEEALTDTSSGAGGTAGSGSGVTVALSGDTPGSMNVPSYSTLVPWVTVNFTAASDGDVTVKNLVFTRKGAGNASDFDGGYIFVGDDRLSTKRSVNTSDNTITFTGLNMNVPAGATKAATLKMNAKTTAQVTGNHYFELTSASAVTTNGAVVSGSFPITGNTLAYSAVDAATVVFDGTETSYTYKIGETNVIASEFTIQNSSSDENVNIYRIRLKDGGDTTDSALTNYSLDLDGTVVKEGITMESNYIDFILDTPFELKKSKTITATVRGDVNDDIGKDLELYLQNVADVDVRGTAYGNFYSAAITSTAFDTAYGTGAGDGDEVNIQGSEVNVSFDGPQAQEVKDDIDDVVLANFKIKSENMDINIETLPVTITMYLGGTVASSTAALDNLEMVDDTNDLAFTAASDPSGDTVTETENFENILLQKGVQYNFQIRGDINDAVDADTTYKVSIDFSSGFTARFQDANETSVDYAEDLSSASLTGKTMTVAAPGVSLNEVTTNAATVVENKDGVLLFKGKITANSVDDLEVSKLEMDGYVGFAGGSTLSVDFEKVYLYKINSDGSETKLDDEASLSSSGDVTFQSFTLDIPKGVSNGVYIAMRGDVKDSPTATTTKVRFSQTKSDCTVRDSDNNSLVDAQKTISATYGHITTVASAGTFTMAMDVTESGTNANKNVLAGTEVLAGRIKLTAANEAAILEDFTLINLAGTADNTDIAEVRLYSDKAMTTLLGSATMDSSKRATFEDVNIDVSETGSTYVYVACLLKGIDYSGSPSADATGEAGNYVEFYVATTTGYTVKALGYSTGDQLANTGVDDTTKTKQANIMGATMSNITTSFANGLLSNGIKEIFSFKVTAPDSDNVDSDGDPLAMRLGTTTFTISTSTGVGITDLKVKRVGGAGTEKTCTVGNNCSLPGGSGSTFSIGFHQLYSTTESDGDVAPGETAEYTITATVSGVQTSDSLQVTIETVDSNVAYTHNFATTGGTRAGYITPVNPLLPGISSVRGGTLSN